MTPTAKIGRPRGSSAETIADAASELFLEQGYAGTTVDQIASRAGVSRGTFFNYFGGKGDLLWLDVDRSVALLPEALRRELHAVGPGFGAIDNFPDPAPDSSTAVSGAARASIVGGVARALVAVASAHDDGAVPWALTQREAMGLGDELTASAAARVVAAQAAVASAVTSAVSRTEGRPDADFARLVASTAIAAAGSAFVGWARVGIGRGPLQPRVRRAVEAVAAGLSGYVF